MRNIFLIAGITYKEAIRNKLLNVLLLFAVIAKHSHFFIKFQKDGRMTKIVEFYFVFLT